MAKARSASAADYNAPARAPAVLKLHLWAPSFVGFGGGIAAFSRDMALGLGDLGHQPKLFGKTDTSGVWAGYELTGAGPIGAALQTPAFGLSNLAAVALQRPDHIISTHVNFGPLARVANQFFGTPYTLVAHGIDVHPGLSASALAGLRHAEKIIAVSAWTRDRVIGLGGIEPGNVSILPNTIDESRFTVGAPRPGLREKYGIALDEKIVLTVARLDPRERYKGYDRMVEAMPAIQRACGAVRFLIVGKGEDQPRIAALARERGVEASVTFAGFVPPEDLADHYRLADVFAMPSTGEGFGIVFAESMACGTPVVAGNRDGSVDAVEGGELGKLIDPTSVDAIASAVCDMICKRGPGWWFDRDALHRAVVKRFGRDAFRERLRQALPFEL